MHIKIYYHKIRYKWLWMLMLVFGLFVFITGGSEAVRIYIWKSQGYLFYDNGLNAILLMLQGSVFIFWAIKILYYTRYFIEIEDDFIRYFEKGMKRPETLYFNSIKNLEIKLMEVVFYLENGTWTLKFENIDYKYVKALKTKLAEIHIPATDSP